MQQHTEQRPGLAALLVDQRLDEFDDALLSGCGGVQFAEHFGKPAVNLLEPAVNLLETSINVITQINEVLSEGVETRCRGVSEIADLGSDLGDVAVGGTGEHSGRGGVLLDGPQPPTDVVEVIVTHNASLLP